MKKIEKIRDQFGNVEEFKPQINDIPQLKCFLPLMMEEVQKEIKLMKNKSCELDIISSELLKEVLPSCIEIITHIVNI